MTGRRVAAADGGAAERSSTALQAAVARRVRDGLREEITSGCFRDGLLPPEWTLIQREHVSRNAVRLALSLLGSEGLIRRRRGIGTVILRERPTSVPLDPPRSSARLYEDGDVRVRYELLGLETTPAPTGIARRLRLAPGQEVVFLERRTHLDGRPLDVSSAWLPADVAGCLLDEGTEVRRRSLFDLLTWTLGLPLGVSEYWIEATTADETVAPLLELPPGAPVLLLETLTSTGTGRPVALAHSRGRADRVAYVASGQHRPVRQLPGRLPEPVPPAGPPAPLPHPTHERPVP